MSFGASKGTKEAMQQQQAMAQSAQGYMNQYNPLALQNLTSASGMLQGLAQGGPLMQRLLAGQFNTVDQAVAGAQRGLAANPQMQRGGAMNLSFANLGRQGVMQKGQMTSEVLPMALQGMMGIGQTAGGLGGQMGSLATQGYSSNVQNRLQADQMKWANLVGLGKGLAGFLFPGGLTLGSITKGFGGLLGGSSQSGHGVTGP